MFHFYYFAMVPAVRTLGNGAHAILCAPSSHVSKPMILGRATAKIPSHLDLPGTVIFCPNYSNFWFSVLLKY